MLPLSTGSVSEQVELPRSSVWAAPYWAALWEGLTDMARGSAIYMRP